MHGKPYDYKEHFVERWAEYVLNHDDWSVIQARFLNAQLQSARAAHKQIH